VNSIDNNLNLEINDRISLFVRTAANTVIGTVHKSCHFLRTPKMKKIKLTQGQFALVDDEDYDWINQWNWHAIKKGRTYYAKRNVRYGLRKENKSKSIYMHYLLLTVPEGKLTDHQNGNGLDNRRRNLRSCSYAENARNQKTQRRQKSSKYKGVSWHKGQIYKGKQYKGKWMAHIKINKKTFHLGLFIDEVVAAQTYDQKAIKLFGEFAYLNFGRTI